MSEAVLIAIITAVAGGIGGLFTWISKRVDKKLEATLAERNQQRDEIRQKISSLETKVDATNEKLKKVVFLVMACEHPDCKVKHKVLEELE